MMLQKGFVNRMSEELKACPFCGRKPEIRHNADGFSYVLCANDGCYARTDGCLNDNEAAKAWNRRAKPGNKPLTLEQLKCMNHKPVWATGKRSLGTEVNGWMLVNATSSRPATLDFTGACNFDSYGKTWIAYARKPEGRCSMA